MHPDECCAYHEVCSGRGLQIDRPRKCEGCTAIETHNADLAAMFLDASGDELWCQKCYGRVFGTL
jgi:hypothetical protein